MRNDVHDGDTGNFSDSAFEVLVAGGHDEASMLLHSFHNAIVGIGSFVAAFKSLKTRVLRDSEGETVLNSKFLQFCHDAIADVGDALAEEAVHAGFEDIQFVLDGKVDEIGIDEDAVGWSECVIMREEEAGGLFGAE